MEVNLYPRNLKELDLSFTEAIYAIAFGLEEELHAKGKAEVFAELDLTPEQMADNVEKTLVVMYSHLNKYALRRVLGDLDASQDAEIFGEFYTLELCFEHACKELANGVSSDAWSRAKYHYLLLGGQPLWVEPIAVQPKQAVDDLTLRERIALLTAEVQFYSERCHCALEQLQTLAAIVEAQESSTTSDIALEDVPTNSAVIDGIYWPYRSAEVLRKLKLTETEKIVEFFGDFQNFVNAKSITLMEWLVITTILRNKKLLHATGNTVIMTDQVADSSFSIRTKKCLVRARIQDIEDMIAYFADGAETGWHRLRNIRQLGRKSLEDIIQRLMALDFTLEDSWCYVTDISPVGALDFSKGVRSDLQYYQIQTVGQLQAACQDRHRFTGLRYVDKELYDIATAHLDRYGF